MLYLCFQGEMSLLVVALTLLKKSEAVVFECLVTGNWLMVFILKVVL